MTTAKNEITGKLIKTPANSRSYQDNHDKIFDEKKKVECGHCGIKNILHHKNQKCRYCGVCLDCE